MSLKFLEGEKIFIAGANGMVGSSIKKELLSLGYNEENLLCPRRESLDFLNYKKLSEWFIHNKPSIVIIAAAKVGGIYANSEKPFDFILQNLKIQTNIIELSWINNVKKLLFLGSSCIYPKYSPQPINENHLLKNSLEQTNEFYAIAKIAGIKLCQSLMIQHQFNAICLMPSNLYGPGDNYNLLNSHVIPALIRKFHDAKLSDLKKVICWGDGSPLREFLFVDDLAKACVFLLNNWNPVNDLSQDEIRKESSCIINVGTNDEIKIKDLATQIAFNVGFKGEIIWDKSKPNGTPRKKLDNSKINNLGWLAKTNLNQGLRITIDSYIKELKNNTLRK
tara:strand:+ start:790 stop:1794 length:1005 start_codon:yes stop_codon:yes gene_type:complete